jgi:hypothetical protein
VFPGLHGGSSLFRMEIRRTFYRHCVKLLLQQPLVTGKAGVTMPGFHVEFLSRFGGSILEVVGHGHNFIVAVFLEQIGNPFPAPATADQAEGDFRIGL